jgi:hypothetical protein
MEQVYTKRFDTFMKRWIMDRHEGGRVTFVASYPETEEALVDKVMKICNDRNIRIDVT